jgi:hypothetical protein
VIGARHGAEVDGKRSTVSYFLEDLLVEIQRYARARRFARARGTMGTKRHATTHRHALIWRARGFSLSGGHHALSTAEIALAAKRAAERLALDFGGCGCWVPVGVDMEAP